MPIPSLGLKFNSSMGKDELTTCFMLLSCLAYSLTIKTCHSETLQGMMSPKTELFITITVRT
jgi:hypothetical protein